MRLVMHAERQISVVVPDLIIGPLYQYVFKRKLCSGSTILLRLSVDAAVIQMVVCMVFKRRCVMRIGRREIKRFCRHCLVAVLLQSVLVRRFCELVVRLVLIIRKHIIAIIQLKSCSIAGLQQKLAFRICSMLRRTSVRILTEKCIVAVTKLTADTIDVLYITAGQNVPYIDHRATEVNNNRIIFKSGIDKIIADASDVSDLIQILPVLHDRHLTAHAILFQNLIKDVDLIIAVLRHSLLVDRIHNGKRALVV